MWYKRLNPNCDDIFLTTEECDKHLDCGKQDLREAASEERKPSLDKQIEIANSKVQPPQKTKKPKPQQREIGERYH